jgi:hypothetical protein
MMEGFPWFRGKEKFSLPAYSEFMPPPRVGRRPYGETDPGLFREDDPFGWTVSEIEEEWELRPGLRTLGKHIVGELVKLGEGRPDFRLAGHAGGRLVDNPYWPGELAALAGRLEREKYVIFLPLALSRTQDDKGRIRWTLFGSSEQGPEKAFWRSFYEAPGREAPQGPSLVFLLRILKEAFGIDSGGPADLRRIGFRILPTEADTRFPYWPEDPLPSWTRGLIVKDGESIEDVRYLLTFRPFSRLPSGVKKGYAAGRLALLPFPGSLVFWGSGSTIQRQEKDPLAMQMPLLRLVARRDAPYGLRVPQSGWFHEPGPDSPDEKIVHDRLVNTYRRSNRWDRVLRHEEDAAANALEVRVSRALFATTDAAIGLYSKPMARNCQIWTEQSELLLDGPRATTKSIREAAMAVAGGGLFRYRFQFPAMRVGRHEIYWHRPLTAFRPGENKDTEVMADGPTGFLTAYSAHQPNPACPVMLWPRLLRRESLLAALDGFKIEHEHYARQTALNVQALFDARELWGALLPRSFARDLLRVAEEEDLSGWLEGLPAKALGHEDGEKIRAALEDLIEPAALARAVPGPSPVAGPESGPPPEPLTFSETATRAFEVDYWNDIRELSNGTYANSDNADFVPEPAPAEGVPRESRRRDLESLGDYLLERHSRSVASAGMAGRAVCGEIRFHWKTDFDYELFTGWRNNRDGHASERNLLVVIPGRDRGEAVVLADHYDTAYMEDVYDRRRGGNGARRAAAGADDNRSATATLLQAAPIFLKMSREGRLERDIWLLHLTGEEFPADCMGARRFARALVEGTLRMMPTSGEPFDLSAVRVAGVYVMDMIAHNRDDGRDVFQISPGRGPGSLHLAREAHLAARTWNACVETWNRHSDRRGRGRGRRSGDEITVPDVALHPRLFGEIRTWDDPRSSLFNTDGQIFSDAGIPVVLFMENYDINRKGYHDTLDTMANIDLDYGAAVAAIAIESAARAAVRSG